MSDRELLELAAKAAGLRFVGVFGNSIELYDGRIWNPLTDDGDALRLAVKLGLAIHIWPDDTTVMNCAKKGELIISAKHGNDPHAGTRRAIVRAAATIGKEMK